MYFFLLAYSILGAGLKYVDDAFDEKTFNKKLALILTPILSIIGAYTMLIDPVSATILFAILCGVLIKGKIDNYAFFGGLVLVIAMVFLAGVQFLFLPLLILAAAAILDEVGNDYIDKKREDLDENKVLNKFAIYFFGHRWIMKAMILFLVFLAIVPAYFFIAMIFFDYAYISVGLYTQAKKGTTNSAVLRKAVSKVGLIFK